MDILKKNLKARGYEVQHFATGQEAADYLDSVIDGTTVAFGGSATLKALGLYERLAAHNEEVIWHWEQEPNEARRKAMTTDIYMTSVNAISETGEMVNIDGVGNRVSSTLFGHKKVYYVIGANKVTETFGEALCRARNVAAPARAKQFNKHTPCVEGKNPGRCYDCNSPDRICRGMVVLWGPMAGMEAEVILIDEEYGL